MPLPLSLLAQHAGHGDSGATVMTILLVTVLAIVWTLVGVVCWIFWRAKKREDEAKRLSSSAVNR